MTHPTDFTLVYALLLFVLSLLFFCWALNAHYGDEEPTKRKSGGMIEPREPWPR